jgi:urease accessory protein
MSVALLLLSDGRFPTGGYAHSGGLEEAVADGVGTGSVPAFLTGRLEAVAAAESVLAVAAARAARQDDLERLLVLDEEAEARCASPPLRAAASRLGAQLLRTAVLVWPDAAVVRRYREASGRTPRPVAFGVVGAAAGLGDRELARASLYEDAASVATAAVRLLPIDSATTARWLLEAAPLVERLADDAATAETEDPRRLPAAFAPALELRSLAHAGREGRLFAS